MSRVASAASSRPLWALRLGKRVLRYLISTRTYGLVYRAGMGEPRLETFADASFEPDCSQSGVATYVCECLVDWRSIKQAQPARSTAEAEITSLAMGCLMMEGTEAVLGSMFVRPASVCLWGDNSASLAVAMGQGSWRTRCLANRASALRSRLHQGTLQLGHVPTAEQRADGLTKILPVPGMARVRSAFGLRA